ncbi:Phage minor structural protein [uncultured Mediterranean phage uvMED]|nr:Phage minor structural protein [uncultured Mediterranean phage uvMED]
MADENKEVVTPPTPNNEELNVLRDSVKKLEAKNYELIGKLQKKEKVIPDDYDSLLAFKQKSEQEELERKGKYTEATTALEQQYRERSAEDKAKIDEQQKRIRELELITPALQALSEVTHDPELVLNNLVPKDQIQNKDGMPVIVDGYEHIPVADYVKNKLEKEKPYLLKTKTISGTGAPVGKPTNTGNFSEEMLKPFLKNSENITEQSRIAKVYGVETWQKLRNIAESR